MLLKTGQPPKGLRFGRFSFPQVALQPLRLKVDMLTILLFFPPGKLFLSLLVICFAQLDLQCVYRTCSESLAAQTNIPLATAIPSRTPPSTTTWHGEGEGISCNAGYFFRNSWLFTLSQPTPIVVIIWSLECLPQRHLPQVWRDWPGVQCQVIAVFIYIILIIVWVILCYIMLSVYMLMIWSCSLLKSCS